MDLQTLALFSVTVLPLVCTPGPDILFIASQALSGGAYSGMRATTGVVLGYCFHSLMAALGLAAVVAASPALFEAIRWAGITYLAYLALKLIRSAARPGGLVLPGHQPKGQLYKGFVTSLLNPKGMMVYLAVLPQFMDRNAGNATLQAIVLSAAFMFWCAVVYTAISVAVGRFSGGGISDRRRQVIDGTAGGMILLAAGFMAAAHH